MSNSPDYYSILGIRRTASPDEVRRAYFEAAKKFHPDRNLKPGETEIFLEVQEAFEVLSDPLRRAKYDQSLPEDENSHLPVKIQVLYSRESLIRQNSPQLVYALVEFSPPLETDKIPTLPLNVCLVIDRSNSMKGEKMDIVKTTAIEILRSLKQADTFSIVAFSDKAEVILPALRESDLSRAETRIQRIQPAGGTEMFQGLQAGYEEVSHNYKAEQVNQIILLTDGRTYGDEDACLELASQAAAEGIGISGLGIGKNWNDRFLDSLSHRTGGSCIYVSRPKDIQRLLVSKFNQLSNVYIDDLILEYTTAADVELTYAFRLQPDAGPVPRENPVHLGLIQRDDPLSILLELKIKQIARDVDTYDFLTGKIFVSSPTDSETEEGIGFILSRPVTEQASKQPPPQQIIQALSNLTLYRLQERASHEIESGDYESAARHLKSVATNLLIQGKETLARTVMFEVENLERDQSFSEEGGKEIKFGTRALLMPPGKNQ